MKTKFFFLVLCIIATSETKSQNTFPASGSVGIGTVTPNSSAICEMNSTTQGLLTPRMTKAQRLTIVSPATGLLVYQTDYTKGFYYWDSAAWIFVTTKYLNKNMNNLLSPTLINVDLVPDTNNLRSLGSAAIGWKKIYLTDAIYLDSLKFIHNTGTANTFVGERSGISNSSGLQNVGNGFQALYTNSSGYANCAIGNKAMYFNSTGYSNVAVGDRALYFNSAGWFNTATGSGALYNNTLGIGNTVIGAGVLNSNTVGSANTAIGFNTMFWNIAGSQATAIGYNAMYNANSTAIGFLNFNVAVGYEALKGSATPADNTGNNNTAIGYQTLLSNSWGSDNTALGVQALNSNTSGYNNTALGYIALKNNILGNDNTAVGLQSLMSNYNGYENTAAGKDALNLNYTGYQNTAVGMEALYLNTAGYNNVANGKAAMFNNTSGNYNVAIGSFALLYDTSGSNNTAVGATAFFNGTYNNSTALGSSTEITASNQVRLGYTVTSIGGQQNWTNTSDARIKTNVQENVPGIEFIKLLRPVTFNKSIRKENEITGKKDSLGLAADNNFERIRYTGFIAQEVEQAAKKIGYDFSGVDAPKNDKDIYGLRYAEFVVPIVKAMQEQQKIIEEQQKQIDALKTTLTNAEMNDGALKLEAENPQRQTSLLGQNIPNPFDNSTVIPFRIPKDCNSASIVISEAGTGKLVSAIPITCHETHLVIESGKLAPGTYIYSLYVDGNNIHSKQMILTR